LNVRDLINDRLPRAIDQLDNYLDHSEIITNPLHRRRRAARPKPSLSAPQDSPARQRVAYDAAALNRTASILT